MSVDDPPVEHLTETITIPGPWELRSSGGRRILAEHDVSTGQEVPSVVDRFVMREQLGAGGMGRVYLAYDLVLARDVALKISGSPIVDPSAELRLRREAQALARLSHPNVVPVFTAGLSEGRAYVAMECIRGQTLARWLRQGPPDLEAIWSMFEQAGRGLAAIHAAGLVHGDFKPSNVMVAPDGWVRVVDLGLACALPSARPGSSPGRPDACVDVSTLPNVPRSTLRGTPMYMAPEGLEGAELSPLSDQFSYCVALYFALYGSFPGGDEQARSRSSPECRRPDLRVPASIHRVVERGLEPDPNRRWPSMDALVHALTRALRRHRHRHQRRLWGLLVAACVVVSLLWEFEADEGPCGVRSVQLMAGVWDLERRRAVAEAGATGSGDADEHRQVLAQVDAYVDEWLDAFDATCERAAADPDTEIPDAVLACLGRRRDKLGAYVEVLATRRDEAVPLARSVLEGLDPVATCLVDPSAGPLELPGQSKRAIAVRRQRNRLHQAEAMSELGRHADALLLVEGVEREAEPLDHPPLLAEALAIRGLLHRWLGDLQRGRRSLQDAYFIAKASGYDELAVRAATELMLLVGVYQGDYDEAEIWSQHASSSLERVRADNVRARYYEVLGGLYEQQRRLDDAMVAHSKAIALIEGHFGTEHPRLASALFNAGLVLVADGRFDEAILYFQRCLTIAERALGPWSTRVGSCNGGLGGAFLEAEDYARAEESLTRALAIYERTLGPNSLHALITITSLGQLYAKQGRAPDARAAFDDAIDRWAEADLTDPRDHVAALVGRASLDVAEGRFDDAERAVERATRVVEQASGDWGSLWLDVFGARARLLIAQGHHADAEAIVAQAEARVEDGPRWQEGWCQLLEAVAAEFDANYEWAHADAHRQRAANVCPDR